MNAAGITDLVPAQLRRQWAADGTYPNRSVFDLFHEHAVRHPEAPAVLTPDETVSYGQLLDSALRLAAALRNLGVVPGDVVAHQLPNSWRSAAIDLAVAALGAVVAPFPPGRGSHDIRSLVRRCAARVLIIPQHHGDTDMRETVLRLRPVLPSLRFVVVDGVPTAHTASLSDMLASEPLDLEETVADPDSPVRLLVSSGTEAEPKLVAYSHNALVGGRGRFLERLQRPGQSMRAMFLVPLGSSFGSCGTFGVLSWLGGSLVLLPKFDSGAALDAVHRLRPTHIMGVPTMFQRMLADPRLSETDCSSVTALVSGGSLVDEATVERCRRAFGCSFVNLYGSADGVNCHTLLDDPPELVRRSIGVPNPRVCEIRIVDEHGREQPAGAVGEILARGPMSPMQYVNAPELDERYRTEDGWVRTGDLGLIDGDGRLRLAGRKKDIIIRGGANISPAQVEALIVAHPDVVSAACVPVPDADLGQRVCACVVPRPGAEPPTLTELTDHLRARGLEVTKLPEYLTVHDQLPLTPAGKVDKKLLSEKAAAAHGISHTPEPTLLSER